VGSEGGEALMAGVSLGLRGLDGSRHQTQPPVLVRALVGVAPGCQEQGEMARTW